jgi:hypothetical protein
MQFSVPANFQIEAQNAQEAQILLGEMLGKAGLAASVGSAYASIVEKPKLSDGMMALLEDIISCNDYDRNGFTTDLDYVFRILEGMDDDYLAISAGYEGRKGGKKSRALREEFASLYQKYGGATCVAMLLPDDRS